MKKVHTLIVGSGAAGLAAAVRLHAAGVKDILICTEGLKMGTSINTGSDKQTYYKLGMYGAEPDSPVLLARDLFAGGAVHGDIALAEASLSVQTFFHLVSLGVPFPHDRYGQYIGYKTDHDPKCRATSCGPYTSREMCRALIREVQQRNITVLEKRNAVALLRTGDRCCGAVFFNREEVFPACLEPVLAENVVFAVGGPGGLFRTSVYPAVHTGAIGLALEIGAKARNLAESQFGLASTRFRWNVSGSYMQVLPRFISVNENGNDEKEFLREYFNSTEDMYNAVFLKGYQWPFSAGHLPGSSLIDIFVNREITERKRRVFLDYRTDPADLILDKLAPETREYLRRSSAMQKTPIARLNAMNAPAVELYRDHNIHLDAEPLEIAVCAQHNNGGLAGDLHWESVNVRHLFPIGEVNGSHGVTRPGGTALNAGQVGAFRAAEYIAARGNEDLLDTSAAEEAANRTLRQIHTLYSMPADTDWKQERAILQTRMSAVCAFLRDENALRNGLREAEMQWNRLLNCGLAGLNVPDAAETLRNRHLLIAQIQYMSDVLKQISDGVGSRGGAAVIAPDGIPVHPALPFGIVPENTAFRSKTLVSCRKTDGSVEQQWEECRPVPNPDGWFESVWKEYRTGEVHR